MNHWRNKCKIQDSLEELCTQLREYYLVGELKELTGLNYNQVLEECKEYMKDGRITLYASLYDLKGNRFDLVKSYPFEIKRGSVHLDIREEIGKEYISKAGRKVIVQERNLILGFVINPDYVKHVLETEGRKINLSYAN